MNPGTDPLPSAAQPPDPPGLQPQPPPLPGPPPPNTAFCQIPGSQIPQYPSLPPLAGTDEFQIWGNGPPLVLVQGFPFSTYIWSEIAQTLASRYTVYIWDIPIQENTLRKQSRCLYLMLQRHFNLIPVNVVAHGVGAVLALDACIQWGMRYRVLIPVSPIISAWKDPKFFLHAQKYTKILSRLPLRQHAAMVRDHISTASSQGLNSHLLHRLCLQWIASDAGQEAFYYQAGRALRFLEDSFSKANWGKIKGFPVHICWGGDDQWASEPDENMLWDLILAYRDTEEQIIHQSRRLIVPAGHLVPLDAPRPLLVFIFACLL
ncbi:alpha/beta fold hydrolase [Aspergillus melleus]|uniref:alpha/beta fold hydrolase n=1 Tax=Aspergillus melleus TaxID=138277 RepID=UPI001E8CBEE0|nr:uncharacterized protein LDX57_009005 [Aspergillus melleus]KAH8431347.1 hypothetical protein LDX57_009005 [Aspergillus melleus]